MVGTCAEERRSQRIFIDVVREEGWRDRRLTVTG